jgi:hypothetical protein
MQRSEKPEPPEDQFDHERPRTSENEKSKETTVAIDQSADQKNAKDDAKKENGVYGYYLKLWTYATPLDVALRVCGFFAACGAGSAVPLMTLVFGALVNDFNAWGAGATSPGQLQAAVNKNA